MNSNNDNNNNNGWHHAQKFKHVQQPDGTSWVKEKRDNGFASRHPVEQGPRGGQYFTGDDGKQRSVNTVARHVQVWQQDQVREAPGGVAPQGNGGKRK